MIAMLAASINVPANASTAAITESGPEIESQLEQLQEAEAGQPSAQIGQEIQILQEAQEEQTQQTSATSSGVSSANHPAGNPPIGSRPHLNTQA